MWKKVAVLAVAGVVVFLVVYGFSTGSGDERGTVVVAHGLIHHAISGKGTVQPRAELRLTANMIGRVKAILVQEGADVKKGQILVQMDDEHVRAQLSQALARLEEARAKSAEVEGGARPQELQSARARVREADAVYLEASVAQDRSLNLLAHGVISRAQYDEAERRLAVAGAQLQSAREQLSLIESGAREEVKQAAVAQLKRAEADVELARALLDQAVVRAPVDGRIVRRFMEPGEVIVMQRPQPILLLADTRHTRVRAEIDETDARFLQVGQAAEVRLDAFPGRVFPGKVAEVGSMVGRKALTSDDPAERVDTKVVEVNIELLESQSLTWGVSAEVAIVIAHRENVTVVPRTAIQEHDGTPSVMLQQGERFVRRAVRTGTSDEDFVEILDGVKQGDVILRQ